MMMMKGPTSDQSKTPPQPSKKKNATPKKASQQASAKKKPPQLKVVFDSPFSFEWNIVSDTIRSEVLSRLTSELTQYKRVQKKTKQNKKRSKKRQKIEKTEKNAEGSIDGMDIEAQHQEATEQNVPSESSTTATVETKTNTTQLRNPSKYNHFLCLGINSVTKALEKGQLSVVVICKDVEPNRLVQHIPYLTYLHSTPLCVLGGDTSATLGAIFGIRSLIVLGFKKEVDHAHQDLVTFLQSKANSLRIPWLQPCKQKLASTDNLGKPDAALPFNFVPYKAKVAYPKRVQQQKQQQNETNKPQAKKEDKKDSSSSIKNNQAKSK